MCDGEPGARLVTPGSGAITRFAEMEDRSAPVTGRPVGQPPRTYCISFRQAPAPRRPGTLLDHGKPCAVPAHRRVSGDGAVRKAFPTVSRCFYDTPSRRDASFALEQPLHSIPAAGSVLPANRAHWAATRHVERRFRQRQRHRAVVRLLLLCRSSESVRKIRRGTDPGISVSLGTTGHEPQRLQDGDPSRRFSVIGQCTGGMRASPGELGCACVEAPAAAGGRHSQANNRWN